MGLPYVKIPRYTLNLLKCPATRQLGQLHILLFDICFFADGYAKLNGRKVPCKRGEYVGTQQELADLYQHRFDQSPDPQVGSSPSDFRF